MKYDLMDRDESWPVEEVKRLKGLIIKNPIITGIFHTCDNRII